ncbi:SDR family NAD(P)-dependent oxidoreductase [Rubellimicrobium roseum]|uniref:SDR family oxidoreductase n=1 Tax=Rubellimicrobium roseum TaxID=687525 RepID=A0A5C4N826_9RHOB|nr:SDR family NAD(P)-dependent oxidoreductase [Rubellimicrobium roseum]TNC63597.1 SDR family oxidoreductase [Rubellimicrobium roseum]
MAEQDRAVALITGASRNIGRAIAVHLAGKGHDIVVHVGQDQRAGGATAAAVREAGGRAAVVTADLAQPEAISVMVERAAAVFGRLDVVVNNAAIRPESSFETLSYEEWREVMSICLDAPFLVSQAALPHLARSPSASIVNIGGLTGHTGAENRAHVVTAKAGLVGLTKALAHELAGRGIRVNCVAPGLIETDRGGASAHRPSHHASRRNLLGHRGTPEDVAMAVAYLCGPEGRYLTGQTLHVNGGAYLP